MGVAGAAWGTNIGMFVYALLFVIYCKRGKASFDADVFTIRMDKNIIKEIISLGMPYTSYDNTAKNVWYTVNIYRFSCN